MIKSVLIMEEGGIAVFSYEAGARLAQLKIQEADIVCFLEAEELRESGRGEGGFGSTGV